MKEKFMTMYTINVLYTINNDDGSAIRVFHREEDHTTVLEFYEDSNDVDQAMHGDIVLHLNVIDLENLIKALKKVKKDYDDKEKELFMNSD